MRECVNKKNLEWCYQCNDFPCQMLYDLQSYWRTPVVENLRQIEKIGVGKWLEEQEWKWKCTNCDTGLHWFSFGLCPECGEENTDPGVI